MQRERVRLAILAAGIALASLVVLQPFLSSIAWAAVLCYVTWPLYRRVRRPFGRFRTLAAFAMIVLVTAAVVLPALWLVKAITDETVVAYRALASFGSHEYPLPAFLRRIPWLGDELQRQIAHWRAEPAVIGREAAAWLQRSTLQVTAALGRFGRGLAKLLITLLTAFFIYRDGDALRVRGRRALDRFAGARLDPYLAIAGSTTRAVVYGVVMTTFAQGVIAGLGYLLIGVEGAALLGVLTGLLSVVPIVGTSLVWGSVGLYLIAAGHPWKGVALLAWGFAVVHPTDNVLRPLLISNVARIPFLPTMFGVIGGAAAFGLIGVIIGPVVLAIALALWRRWTDGDAAPA